MRCTLTDKLLQGIAVDCVGNPVETWQKTSTVRHQSDDWCWCVIDHGSGSNIYHRVISLSSFYRIVTKTNVDVSISKAKTAPTTKPETCTHNYIHTITHTVSNYVRRQLLLISMHFSSLFSFSFFLSFSVWAVLNRVI